MKTLGTIRRSALVVIAALIPVAVACSDGFEPPAGLAGTWNATSLIVDGDDYVAEGMTLRFTFSDNGDYSYTVTGDLLDFCDAGGPNCSDGGDYTATSSQLTFDPGSTDEETFSWTIAGDTLTVSGTIDGLVLVFTFQRQ